MTLGADPLPASLIERSATIDEVLSDVFETGPADSVASAVQAMEALAAWRDSVSGGDRLVFRRRLAWEGLDIDHVLARLGSIRFCGESQPAWLTDAAWVLAALRTTDTGPRAQGATRHAFGDAFTALATEAERRLWTSVDPSAGDRWTRRAQSAITDSLLSDLSRLCAPLLYQRFSTSRTVSGCRPGCYDDFIADLRSGGFANLFEEKPVLLRLIATLTRQWLDFAREFVTRLDRDLGAIREGIPSAAGNGPVGQISFGLSDRHGGGRSVLRVGFIDGGEILYKPRDVRVDVAWHSLIARLNVESPVQLRAPRTLVGDGYGWTEFIAHSECEGEQDFPIFFQRAGAWLALLHCLAASDIHQDNVIAAGSHPVPVDLETTLQPIAADNEAAASHAHQAAQRLISDSVLATGLLPGYGRNGGASFAVGGLTAHRQLSRRVVWQNINSDLMSPMLEEEARPVCTNIAYVHGRYARLGDHLDDLIAGFRHYAEFLLERTAVRGCDDLLAGFSGLPVRVVLRPTQFYSLLLNRLRDERTMAYGPKWSAQADFVARVVNRGQPRQYATRVMRAERNALLRLDVPMFHTTTDGHVTEDESGTGVRMSSKSGLQRAMDRLGMLSDDEIARQTALIEQATILVAENFGTSDRAPGHRGEHAPAQILSPHGFITEADAIVADIAQHAIRCRGSAAWIGLSWLPDSEVARLAVLGHDMYSGAAGIAMFLAAHAAAQRDGVSAELALEAVAHTRAEFIGHTGSHLARVMGLGGASGVASIVYVLTHMSQLLGDGTLLADAHRVATLITDELVAADTALDILGGCAGAILCLVRLYEIAGEPDILDRAVRCGEHLLSVDRVGSPGQRTWRRAGSIPLSMTGMAHGAAGFGYAMAVLGTVSGRSEFCAAATECFAFELSGGGAVSTLRDAGAQWCHGATGTGLAWLGTLMRAGDGQQTDELGDAVSSVLRARPPDVDTLCCGASGTVELLREAGQFLNRDDWRAASRQRLSAMVDSRMKVGDYRWNGGARPFNLGLFRGLAGIGYTCLREVDRTLPNVLMWG